MAGQPPETSSFDPVWDGLLAARLFAFAPKSFGGMVLRGASPARDALVSALCAEMETRRLPGHVDDERLLGGIDLAASLAAGKPIIQTGLLTEAKDGALIVPMAERLDETIAGRLAQACDEGGTALIMLDDSVEAEDAPPASLMERCAFHCDVTASREWEPLDLDNRAAIALAKVAPLNDEALMALAATAAAFGVHSLRPLLFAGETARAHAALSGRTDAIEADLSAAARLVLGPRATQLPAPQEDTAPEQPPEQPPEPPESNSDEPSDTQNNRSDQPLEEMLVEAAAAAIPADLLAQLAKGLAPRKSGGSGSGQKRKSGMRGKPLGARPGMPRGGARLALIDTLRAAVPWQQVRRKERQEAGNPADPNAILTRKDDLRVRRFDEKAARVTIFAVDASGSAAAARLAEAKGAVELMLAQAYVTRSEVALVSFRGDSAELLLPPTRSLTRARRALAELPGGGGTPLAMGLNAAREAAESVIARGRTASLVILTDGRANIGGDGSPGRKQAGEDAEAAAKAIARSGIDSLVVDISSRPGPDAPALADTLQGRFLALPRADAKTLHKAISAVNPAKASA
ncbi:magnesium chelatase subunit D [Erythrobacter insulae]|uniref:Magnesium chelatase subunit D n=1 Tax=Erythrobacter insulae TaxID=2584124 RepID=A0A547PD05_9SPHN|nr:magnesium chelatase subunit D [Erythrobacter insulae]TRD12010.1 magnesium chelatase subunit D [Erythrobacter insulae]